MLKLIIQGGLALFALLVLVGVAVIVPLNREVAELVDRVAALEAGKPAAGRVPSTDLAPLQEQVRKLSERLEAVAPAAAEMDRLAQDLRMLTVRMTALESTQPAVPAEPAPMGRKLAELAARVDALARKEPPKADFAALRAEMEGLTRRLAAVEAKEAAAPADVEGLHRAVGDLTARVEGLERRDVPPPVDFVLLQREVKTLTGRLAALEGREAPAPADLAPLRTEISHLAGRLAALEQRPLEPPVDMKALVAQVERLAALVEAVGHRRAAPLMPGDRWKLDQEINKLGYRLEALEDERRAASDGVGALRGELRALEQRLDTLAKRLPPAAR